MQFIQGTNRHQTYFTTPEDQVSADNAVRLMDAFIDKPDLQKLGIMGTVHKSEVRPPYAPGVLLVLYLYGYLNKICSSRKLERECSRNIELQWLLQSKDVKASLLVLCIQRRLSCCLRYLLDYFYATFNKEFTERSSSIKGQ